MKKEEAAAPIGSFFFFVLFWHILRIKRVRSSVAPSYDYDFSNALSASKSTQKIICLMPIIHEQALYIKNIFCFYTRNIHSCVKKTVVDICPRRLLLYSEFLRASQDALGVCLSVYVVISVICKNTIVYRLCCISSCFGIFQSLFLSFK